MLNEKIHPSTLNGIKRRAKQLKKANGISHHEALKIAAKSAFYENYTHARNSLKHSKPSNSAHHLFFTVYWYDRTNQKSGREVLEIELSTPLLQIATKNELKYASGLRSFRLASPDHFVCDSLGSSQEHARNTICKAVRVLQFIEATGLKPSNDFMSAYPNKDRNNRLPQADHSSDWYDPETGQFILIDEPYLDPVVKGERAAWAQKHNWHLQGSQWPGMYYPYNSNLFVATDATTGYDFKNLMDKIDNIPAPLTSQNWTGISSEGHETFYSPLCVTPQDKRRAAAKGTLIRSPSSKTVPLRSWDSPNNWRRPNAVMPVESHLNAAKMILAIQQSEAMPSGVYNRLSSIKSELEDWFFSEHDSDTTNQFDLFYYDTIDPKDPIVTQAKSVQGVIFVLQKLKALLLDAYVDCEPLRRIIGKLDTSIKLTSKQLSH